MNATEK